MLIYGSGFLTEKHLSVKLMLIDAVLGDMFSAERLRVDEDSKIAAGPRALDEPSLDAIVSLLVALSEVDPSTLRRRWVEIEVT